MRQQPLITCDRQLFREHPVPGRQRLRIGHAGKKSEAQETGQSAERVTGDSFTLDALRAGVKQDGAGLNGAMIPGVSRSLFWMGEVHKLWQGESRGHWNGDC